MDRLEVWSDQDQWRWAFRDGNGVELLSNQLYERRAEAEEAARLAYPDVRLEGLERAGGRKDRRLLVTIVVLLLAVIGLGIVLKRVQRDEEGG